MVGGLPLKKMTMTKKEIFSKFNIFRNILSVRYGKSYFKDEVLFILRNNDYIIQMIKIERENICNYSEFSNYDLRLDSEKIKKDDSVILLTIRHFDMYIEYILKDDGSTIISNLKNIPYGKNELNKLSELEEYFFIKGQPQSSENLFKADNYKIYVDYRKPIMGGWRQENLKIYFKDDNRLVFIINESVLFGKYYFLQNYVKLNFENYAEFNMSESLYYEFRFDKSGSLILINENYRHFYVLEKL